MNGIDTKIVKRILGVLFAIILVAGVAHAASIDVFNKTERSAFGADESQATYLKFDNRADSTSTWVKRDYDLRGTRVDLQAQTVDGVFVNNSDDTVSSWEATMTMEQDCFINNAWVGTVEIHQYVGTEHETTQTLDLRSYDLAEVKLDYLYDGDLLIPLSKGDYIVYHPSKADEFDIKPHSELTMGMIFYYLNDLSLTDYSIHYFYHRDLTYGIAFIALFALSIVWLLLLAGTVVANASYKRAMREADLKKTGLSSMSSIYSVISFIDLEKDELIPIYADEKAIEELPQGPNGREKLLDIFRRDTAPAYRTSTLDFVDTNTLAARLEKGSISLEYVSMAYGWSKIRFFAVDREQGEPIKQALLTIEDINDEKREKEQFEQEAKQLELGNLVRASFIAGISDEMRYWVQSINELAKKISDEADNDAVRVYVKQIRGRGDLLTHLIDSAVDSSGNDDIQEESTEYSFTETIHEVCDIAKILTENDPLVIDVNISPSIPPRLIGDARRIQRVLLGIIAQTYNIEHVDAVKIAAYGNAHEGKEHILLSVKMVGSGLDEAKEHELAEFIANFEQFGTQAIDEDIQVFEGVALLLRRMESKLQMVNEPEEGVEFYFELEQKIPDPRNEG